MLWGHLGVNLHHMKHKMQNATVPTESKVKRVFKAPLYYQDGQPFVKAEELTEKDKRLIKRVLKKTQSI